jgi:hypothetical protein
MERPEKQKLKHLFLVLAMILENYPRWWSGSRVKLTFEDTVN